MVGERDSDQVDGAAYRPGRGARLSREFAGTVVIVTGAATGIGRAIARRFGQDGACVVINHLDTPDKAQAVASEIKADESGAAVLVVQADVSRRSEFERLFAAAAERFGHVDVLVNNAAVALLRPIGEASEADIDTVLNVNVKGMLWGCQLAAQQLVDGGRIINISSSTTGLALPGYGIYDMTKGAMEQITRILAREIGGRSITVNAVAPGATETETYRNDKSDDFLKSLENMSAFGRLGRVEEIADVVAFVASKDARWITGQVIRVNGGTV
jgi:3-oxoacyl-[acyl-carrier protein] reductase